MTQAQQNLLNRLEIVRGGSCDRMPTPHFGPHDLAELFVYAQHVTCACRPLEDQRWLSSREAGQNHFPDFLAQAFRSELAPLDFLREVMREDADFPTLEREARALSDEVIAVTSTWPANLYSEFLTRTARLMAALVKYTATLRAEREETRLDQALYRAFDAFDQVLGLKYGRDSEMKADPKQKQRLYEGAGAGVQTAYESLILALEELNLPPGASLIDLGSGFGRLGFVTGLLRPDLQFTGFEFVAHRVAESSRVAARAGLSAHVRYFAQDLSDPAFILPHADAYYLFDPFDAETYTRVIRELIFVARHREISIVIKGNACDRFADQVRERGWLGPEKIDRGTIAIFRSQERETHEFHHHRPASGESRL